MPASHGWVGLSRVVIIESVRDISGEETYAHRYYITSDTTRNALQLLQATRSHWEVENCLHWVLDVAFQEDLSRIRKDHGAENFSILQRIALNLLKNEKSIKIGIKNKRLFAGWNEDYMAKVLAGLGAL